MEMAEMIEHLLAKMDATEAGQEQIREGIKSGIAEMTSIVNSWIAHEV
jgi:hypothetical protein